ncbi:MAG: hypothetical protein AAB846_01625, partial [Patescibacteria group bacterium]
MRGALRGAAIGAVGGALGYTVAGLFESYVFGGGGGTAEAVQDQGDELATPEEAPVPEEPGVSKIPAGAEDAPPPASAGVEGKSIVPVEKATEAIAPEEVKMAAGEAYQKTYQKTLEIGVEELKEKNFNVVFSKGQGLTHASREIISDYLANVQALGGDTAVSKGELIYAEDWLRRRMADITAEVGKEVSLKGEDVAAAIEQARTLSEEAQKQIEERWASKISEGTWEKMLNYDAFFNTQNGFAEEIVKEAKEAAEQAAAEAGKEIAAETAATATFEEAIDTLPAGETSGALSETAGTSVEETGGEPPEEEAGKVTKEAADGWLDRQWKTAGKAGPSVIVAGIGTLGIGAIGKTLKEHYKEKRIAHEEKLEADPIRNFFEEQGTPLKELRYECVADEGKIKTFKNYADYRAYWESIGSKGRRLVRNSGVRYGLVWDPEVSKARSNLPKGKEKEFLELRKKIDEGIVADGRAFPEEREIKGSRDVMKIVQEITKETGIDFSRKASTQFSSEEEYVGLQTLQNAIRDADPLDIEILKEKKAVIWASEEKKIEKSDGPAPRPRLFINPHMAREE